MPTSRAVQPRQATLADVSVDKLMLDGARLNARIEQALTAADIETTIDGASTLTLTVYDADRRLVTSGLVTQSSIVTVDRYAFALVGVSKQGPQLTLTFEDRLVAQLRLRNRPRKAYRDKTTRARFARALVREVKGADLWCPELDKRQPIEASGGKNPPVTAKAKAKAHVPAFVPGVRITVNGQAATANQRDNLATVLAVGYELGANQKVRTAAICTVIVESSARNLTGGDRDSQGLFQQRPSQGWRNVRDPEYASRSFYQRAIPVDIENPHFSPGQIAQAVQRSAFPARYDQRRKEADVIVRAYQRGSSNQPLASSSGQKTARYAFSRGQPGQPEDTWTCLGRLADEVQWRRFVVGRTVWFASDAQLLRQRTALVVEENVGAVEEIDFDWDVGKRAQTATVNVRADRWAIQPGQVIEVRNLGPAEGRWLVQGCRRSLFDPNAQITLTRPRPARAEPAAETLATPQTTSKLSGRYGSDQGGDLRSKVVAAARSTAGFITYAQVRPIPRRIVRGTRTDCSGFATACYSMAGAPDPNGQGYSGQGYTGTLWGHGRSVSTPQPGDLAFYGTPAAAGGAAHVVVYVGSGMAMSNGGGTGPKLVPVHYRPVVGYRSYLP